MSETQTKNSAETNTDTSERSGNNEVLQNEDDQRRKPAFLFSVEYILNKAGEKKTEDDIDKEIIGHYDWLYCTRFKPPKLDRIKRKDGENRQKRRPGRNPRIPFTTQQVSVLEREFRRNAYLGGANDVNVLSNSLQLSQSRIKIWFQNRRARDRRDNSTVGRPSYNRDSSTIVQLTQLPVSSTSAFRPPSTTRAHAATNNVRNRRDETAIH